MDHRFISEVRGRRRDTFSSRRPGPGPGRAAASARMNGSVVDPDGKPVAGAKVTAVFTSRAAAPSRRRPTRRANSGSWASGPATGTSPSSAQGYLPVTSASTLPAQQEPQGRHQAGEEGRRLGHRPGRGDLPDPRGGQRLLQGRQVRHRPDDVRGIPGQEPRRLPGPPEHRRLLPREGRVRQGHREATTSSSSRPPPIRPWARPWAPRAWRPSGCAT